MSILGLDVGSLERREPKQLDLEKHAPGEGLHIWTTRHVLGLR